MHRNLFAALLAPALLYSASAVASCGAAFCTVNTDWGAQGLWTEPGTRFGLRFEYMDQDQPQSGTQRVAVGQIPMHHDEVRTINRNWLATLDHGFNERWSMSVALPIVDRWHEHIHNHRGAKLPETWDFTEVGDLRVLGRYTAAPSGLGFNFGLKLPTGRHDVRNADGDEAERTLQPGSGTTDLLLGAYVQGELREHKLAWFAQGLVQAALNTRDEFKPGASLGIDAGLRYDVAGGIGLLLQANVLVRDRDEGVQAEPANSGGRYAWLSPGVSVDLGRDWQIYAFVQLPLYQDVNGVQLVAERAAVLGVSARF